LACRLIGILESTPQIRFVAHGTLRTFSIFAGSTTTSG